MMINAYPILADAEKAFAEENFEVAAQLALHHARSHPGERRGIVMLGILAMRMGAILQAETFFRQALAQDPSDKDIRRKLAAAVHQQELLPEALEMFNQIIADEPGESRIRAIIATILDKLGRHNEARAAFEWLVQHEPASVSNWISYGHNLRAAGKIGEAVQAYRKAIAIDPERGDAWWGLASIKKRVLDDDDIGAMTAAIELAIDNANLAPLHFSMARAMNDRKRYEEAFHHYSEANRLWAETLDYVASELTDEVDESSTLFGSDFLSDKRGGATSEAPIFIVSLPRSGSTLLEQMLDSHPDIEALGELPYIPSLLRSMMETETRRGRCSVPQAITRLTPSARTALGEEYLRRAAIHRHTDAPFFVDKMPHNWSNVAFIRRILPNARFLDIRRGAMSCCFANFTHSFSRAHASSFALNDIGRAYVDYVRLMAHFDQAAPGMVHHVQYETLVQEPELELRRLMEYLRLPWDPAVLSFHESSRTVRTPSAEQVRRPLNREGMENWQPYSQWLGPLRDALGEIADG